jgi:hypothetical protein
MTNADMERSMSRAGTAAVASAALAMVLGASCGDETRFFIVHNQRPDQGCAVSPEVAHAYAGQGRLDASLVGDSSAYAYSLFPLLQNDLPRSGQPGANEPYRLTIEAFLVNLELDKDAPAAARQVFDELGANDATRRFLAFEEPYAATLEGGGGRLAAGVHVVPAEVVRRLKSAGAFEGVAAVRMMVKLRARGRGQNGAIETPVFRFPLDVCVGCLLNLRGACPVAELANPGNVCNLAQDDLVDCCMEGRSLRCPAPVADKTAPSTTTPDAGTP